MKMFGLQLKYLRKVLMLYSKQVSPEVEEAYTAINNLLEYAPPEEWLVWAAEHIVLGTCVDIYTEFAEDVLQMERDIPHE